MYYSKQTRGFYDNLSPSLPSDAVEITHELYLALLEGQAAGKTISVVDGCPQLIDRVVPPDQLVALERNWRDSEIRTTEWLVARHRDELDLTLTTTLSSQQFAELLAYRQALRDWPQISSFPVVEFRPVAPPWIAEQTQ